MTSNLWALVRDVLTAKFSWAHAYGEAPIWVDLERLYEATLLPVERVR